MIKPGEIQKKATQVGVRDQQIEKDYVLSWILWGIANHEQLSKILVFKGGTVLKKVYFEDYRFSEDLDFTLSRGDSCTGTGFNRQTMQKKNTQYIHMGILDKEGGGT